MIVRTCCILGCLALMGCTPPPSKPSGRPASGRPATAAVVYNPATFRADIARLIDSEQYKEAVALVKSADVDRQLAADQSGYIGIGVDMIILPGVHPAQRYTRGRDWYVPGTQDAIEDWDWQATATEFAERYNVKRRGR